VKLLHPSGAALYWRLRKLTAQSDSKSFENCSAFGNLTRTHISQSPRSLPQTVHVCILAKQKVTYSMFTS